MTALATAPLGNPVPELGLALTEFDLQADMEGLVGLRVAPVKEVGGVTGFYPVEPLESLLKDQDTKRGIDGSYQRTNGRVELRNYACRENGIEEPVDARASAAYRSWHDQYASAAMRTRSIVLRSHTNRVFNAALSLPGGQQKAASALLSARTTYDFVKDLDDTRLLMRNATGVTSNALLMDYEAFIHLRDNSSLRDRGWKSNVVDSNRVLMRREAAASLAAVLDLDYVFVSDPVRNTANEMKDATLTPLWPKDKMLLYRYAPNTDTTVPQFMRTLHWGADGSQIGGAFDEYYSNEVRSQVLRHRMDTAEEIVYQQLGWLITGLL